MTTRNPYHKPHRRGKRKRANERVALAKDVIAQLNTKRFIATRGIYVGPREGAMYSLLIESSSLHSAVHGGVYNEASDSYVYDDQHRKDLNKLNKQFIPPPEACNVCAIGAVFVAALDVHDKLKLGDLKHTGSRSMINDYDMLSYLKPWFSVDEMRAMESVFEDHQAGYEFREAILSKDNPSALSIDDRVMRGIMQRIIDTKGALFSPSKEK